MEKLKTTIFTNNGNNVLNFLKLREDEYCKDDTIYCKKCNTCRSVKLDTIGYCRSICDCQLVEKVKQEQLEFQQEQIRKFRELQKSTLLGKRYYTATFETTETENKSDSFKMAYSRCKKYCENSKIVLEKGLGMFVYGKSGVGKTHLFACMVNELTRQGYSCLITNFIEICRHILNKDIDNYEDKLASIDFLFLDDFGTERVRKENQDLWTQEKIYDIINKRNNNCLPTLFNSNHSLISLLNDIGVMPKTIDRICEMSSAKIKIEGDNYRHLGSEQELPF